MTKTNILSMETPNDVNSKLMEVTENFLKNDRHYFGIAAASLQNQLDDLILNLSMLVLMEKRKLHKYLENGLLTNQIVF